MMTRANRTWRGKPGALLALSVCCLGALSDSPARSAAAGNEPATPAHGLEVSGALHCAELTNAQHRAGDGIFQPDRVGD